MLDTLSTTLARAAGNAWLVGIGAAALGIFLGFIVFAYIAQNGLADVASITGLLGVIGGALVMGMLARLGDGEAPTSNIVAAYFIGLLAGAAAYVGADFAGIADGLFPGCDCPSPTPSPAA